MESMRDELDQEKYERIQSERETILTPPPPVVEPVAQDSEVYKMRNRSHWPEAAVRAFEKNKARLPYYFRHECFHEQPRYRQWLGTAQEAEEVFKSRWLSDLYLVTFEDYSAWF